jgi:hypothetical protein
MHHDAGNVREMRPLVLRFIELEESPARVNRDELTSDDPAPPICAASGDLLLSQHTKITMVRYETCNDT